MRGWRGIVGEIPRAVLWACAVLLAQSAFWPDVGFWLKALVAAVAAVTVWRAQYGLIAVAGLAPFGNTLVTNFGRAPAFGLTEALILAFLAGYLTPGRRQSPRRPLDAFTASAWIFGLVIAASCVVQLDLERAWQDHWSRFLVKFVRYLAFDYLTAQPDVRPWVIGPGFLPPALLWLEGIGLAVIARSLCRDAPELVPRLLTAIVGAATGVAVLTWSRVVAAAIDAGVNPLAAAVSAERWTSAIPSINPSGSYFAMTSLVALGLMWAARRSGARAVWLTAAVAITSAGWLTKSRAGIVAWMSMAGAMLARSVVRRRRPLYALLGAGVLVGALVLFVNPFGIMREQASESLRYRQMLAQGAGKMIATYPFFGVGVRQFRLRYQEFRPKEAEGYAEDDPHNHLLGVATELGLVGLAAFLWFISVGMWQVVRGVWTKTVDPIGTGVFVALAAFLITCVSHQPLGVPIVAFTFWMLFGAGIAWGQKAAVPVPSRSSRARTVLLYGTALSALAIFASIPIRGAAAVATVDLNRVQYGFHDWEIDGAGARFHWSSGHSTIFVPSTMSLINLPVSASMKAVPGGVDVRIKVNGEDAGHLQLHDEDWHDVRLVAPRNGQQFYRVDLYVSPTWIPSRLDPTRDDDRELGIRVAEPVQRR